MENFLQTLPNDLNTLIERFSGPNVYYHLFLNEYNQFMETPSRPEYFPLGTYKSLTDAVFDLLLYPEFIKKNVYDKDTKKWSGKCTVWHDLYITESKFGKVSLNDDMIGYRIIDNKLKKFIFKGNGFWYNMVLERKFIEVEFEWTEPEFFTAFFE